MDDIKKFQKKAMMISGTGVGLAAMSGLAADSPDTVNAIGKMGKGLGTMAGLEAMNTSLSMLSKMTKRRY